ncbi:MULTISPECIES: glucosamine-6-phosphate deaminase [Kandleria]|uniref:glucosamine-6-phosphate deaminase n=1 Tax=Kandleria TaxID=1279388 RepID=UPI001B5E564B|nr:glucosamine-6-phosphate deaminase [Kandleria sp.]MBP3277161.1 glucosamine-6-phosphate deaminase [Kandleria sp.]
MNIIVVKNYEEASQKAFEIIKSLVIEKPDANLGLATGSTPIRLYELMCEDHRVNKTSYKDVNTFNLDEYYGLKHDHPQSYYHFMHEHLFKHIDIKEENVHIPSGEGQIEEDCKRYNQLLSNNKRDIQLLGLGSNGHIGFNEPGTSFDTSTHYIALKESTIKDNAALFFNGDLDAVPKSAITMGIHNIMESKHILLIACGKRKAEAVKGMIEGEVTEELPASILQRHPHVTVIIDEEAASLLTK